MIDKQQSAQGSTKLHRFLLAVALTLMITGLNTTGAVAQNIDTFAPVIELEELAQGVADLSQVFTVQIAEDVQLKDATLYHRREGQVAFTPALMEPLSNTGFFSATIQTNPSDLRPIEYYIQARDEAGNRTVNGFAFDPYTRTLSASSLSLSADPISNTSTAENKQSNAPVFYKRRWVQITLGVLAAGAIVSLANSGGGDDSTVVPLTINLQ